VRAADFLVIAALALAVDPVSAAIPARIVVDLPAGPLGDSLIRLAQQAGVTIGSTDPAIARLPARAVKGRLDVDTALRRLLAGLPARADRVDQAAWRVIAIPLPATRSRTRGSPSPPPPLPATDGEIIVTAAKSGTRLARYAGTASIAAGSDLSIGEQAQGSDSLIDRFPSMSSTHLGAGRNKLFIRGIADSSFNGPTQALVGQYLGDVRLNYNAPDPDLSLYDVQSVEVIEGPQGTLYGAGSIAGVLRIVPVPVAMGTTEGSLALGRSFAAHGDPGYDVVAMANLPIVGDAIGARIVAFHSIEGGYIDDAGRGLSNVNRTRKTGGRAVVRAEAGDWRIELGAVIQNISTRDGQYAEAGLPPLTRISRIAQPFDNDYVLGSLTVARDWGALSLVSASAIVRQNTDARYDFTAPSAATARIFDQHNRIYLISNETRLSRRDADGRGWVIGAGLIQDDEKLTRALGDPAAPTRILGVDNSVTEGAVFGEAGFGLTDRLVASIGARFEYAHLVGKALDRDADIGEPRRDETTFLPSLSLSWRLQPDLMLFARYQEGFRPGGLSVIPNRGAPLIQRFHGDDLASIEAGVKWLPADAHRIELTFTASHAHWENIQADLVDMAGLPFTANIGSGRIWGVEATFGWRPFDALKLSAAAFANDSRLTDPAPAFAGVEKYELPNIPHFGATARAAFSHGLAGAWRIDADARAHYVGHSKLGVGPALDLVQGNYVVTGASLHFGNGRWGFGIDADNLLDSRGSLFALGNPYDVAAGNQSVPPRPRTIRIGADARF
jgi:outer membrane receptor protein involved in Fe transport